MHRSFQEYINTPYIEKGEREREISVVNHSFHRDTDGKRRVKSKRQGGEVEGGRKETDPFAKCSSTVFGPFLDALTSSLFYGDSAKERGFFENASSRITLIRFGLQIWPSPSTISASSVEQKRDRKLGRTRLYDEKNLVNILIYFLIFITRISHEEFI